LRLSQALKTFPQKNKAIFKLKRKAKTSKICLNLFFYFHFTGGGKKE
jgi:hypothetical protein